MTKTYKNAIVFKSNPERGKYKPGEIALMRQADNLNFGVGYDKDSLKVKNNVLLFINKIGKANQVIKATKAPKIGWWIGDYREDEAVKNISREVQFIFTSTRSLVDSYKKLLGIDTYYMPLYGLIPSNYKVRSVTWNILFIGDTRNKPSHIERQPFLEKVGKYNLKLIDREYPYTVDMCYLYRNTPISLSISRYKDGSTSNRLFNILASGGFALVKYFPGLDEMFENHKHLVWFNDTKELDRLTKYYLNHPQERKRIAKNGEQLYFQKHTAYHRIKNIFDIMDGKTENFYGYL